MYKDCRSFFLIYVTLISAKHLKVFPKYFLPKYVLNFMKYIIFLALSVRSGMVKFFLFFKETFNAID